MADLGEEAFSSQMKVVTTFLRLLEELMRNKQLDLRYGTKTQRRGILRRMKDFVGGIFKKVYDGTFGRLSYLTDIVRIQTISTVLSLIQLRLQS